MKANP
jgi:hypothetical protein